MWKIFLDTTLWRYEEVLRELRRVGWALSDLTIRERIILDPDGSMLAYMPNMLPPLAEACWDIDDSAFDATWRRIARKAWVAG